MDWLLRYNWSFRIWCVKNFIMVIIRCFIALAISVPGINIILRPITWWRCLNALWNGQYIILYSISVCGCDWFEIHSFQKEIYGHEA